jgi:hypothetical protein
MTIGQKITYEIYIPVTSSSSLGFTQLRESHRVQGKMKMITFLQPHYNKEAARTPSRHMVNSGESHVHGKAKVTVTLRLILTQTGWNLEKLVIAHQCKTLNIVKTP